MGARIAPPFMEATDASRLVCVVVVSYQEYSLTLSAVRVRCFDTDIDSRNAVVKLNETRNAICLAFLNACDSAVAPLDDLAQPQFGRILFSASDDEETKNSAAGERERRERDEHKGK